MQLGRGDDLPGQSPPGLCGDRRRRRRPPGQTGLVASSTSPLMIRSVIAFQVFRGEARTDEKQTPAIVQARGKGYGVMVEVLDLDGLVAE